jgi:hypothetical protein
VIVMMRAMESTSSHSIDSGHGSVKAVAGGIMSRRASRDHTCIVYTSGAGKPTASSGAQNGFVSSAYILVPWRREDQDSPGVTVNRILFFNLYIFAVLRPSYNRSAFFYIKNTPFDPC